MIASGENPSRCAAAALIGALEEVLRQHGQLVAALAQRAQANDQRGQREVQLRPDCARCESAISGSRTVVPISRTEESSEAANRA